ncbi:MAG: hypothetical protein J5I52_03155 [Saprospiraceae bacterium]|nr:MAG: hypothetical protein UZ09_BCD002001729 [Bacteroidetes bacterium OLB9]MCO6463129.1 hypothetical protein [Saprospiraceae bacterium]MCZ2337890.1 hypothetical protein [Chitinophagales bacterium]
MKSISSSEWTLHSQKEEFSELKDENNELNHLSKNFKLLEYTQIPGKSVEVCWKDLLAKVQNKSQARPNKKMELESI